MAFSVGWVQWLVEYDSDEVSKGDEGIYNDKNGSCNLDESWNLQFTWMIIDVAEVGRATWLTKMQLCPFAWVEWKWSIAEFRVPQHRDTWREWEKKILTTAPVKWKQSKCFLTKGAQKASSGLTRSSVKTMTRFVEEWILALRPVRLSWVHFAPKCKWTE